MTRKVIAILTLALALSATAEAKEPFGQWVKHWRERALMKNCDTAYVAMPPYNWQATAGVKGSGTSADFIWPSASQVPRNPQNIFGEQQQWLARYNAGMTNSAVFGLAYKGLGLSFGPKFNNPNKGKGIDLGIDFTGVKFGIDLRAKYMYDGDVEGVINSMTMSSFGADAYYVVNAKKFNLSAAYSQSVIQKRSAGSIIVAAGYLGSSYTILFDDNTTAYYTMSKNVSLGAGYGYNLVFLGGRLLSHASYIPMVMCWRGTWCGAYLEDKEDDAYEIDQVKMTKDPTFPYRHLARASFNYTWRERYLVGFNFYNNHTGIALRDVQQIESAKYPQSMNEWTAQVFFKYRF